MLNNNTMNNTNAMENKGGKGMFKGIRRNVEVTKTSINASNIERLQRKAMHKLYEDANGNASFVVVKRVNINDCGRIEEVFYQTVGMSPTVLAYGKLYTGEALQLPVRHVKDENTGELTPAKPVLVGETETYKLYENIVLVSFVGAESFYEDYRLKGLTLGVNEIYHAVSGSASMNKRSKVYFATGEAEDQFATIDKLTGGVLSTALNDCGNKAIDFDTLAGLASRISLCATTPSLWTKAGRTNNVFLFMGSVQSTNEESNIDRIDNNFRDGYAIISDNLGSNIVSELTGEKVTNAQARRMSYQLRIRGAAGKGHFRAYGMAQRLKEMKMMMEADMSKCFCWVNGKAVDLATLSEKELETVAAQIDIIADKDVFKWAKYIANKATLAILEVGVVNMSNKTNGSMGSQIAFKMRDDMEDACKYFEALTIRQLVEAEAAEGRIGFEKDTVRLSNSAYFNCKNIAPQKAMTDKLLNNFKIKQLDTANLSKIANLKIAINSMYLRLVPEDSLLNNGVEVLQAQTVNYVMPTGEVVKVRALEAFSSAFEKEYKEMKEMLAANDAMTEAEKQTVLNNMRVAVAIKSPSQGDNEFELFYMVTAEEMAQRGLTIEYAQFIAETPNNCIVIAQDNTVKHQLAGSDFDGDDVTVIFPEFTMVETGAIVTGLNHPEHGIVLDYTSIIVRKRARNNNIGYAALIEYGSEEPMRFGDAETEQEEEQAAEYMADIDISSLF